MLKIRLTRRGKKNKAFFRVVVAEHTSPIKGKFLENLGFFNPHTKEKEFKTDRIKYWIEKGAQCSDSVHNMLVSDGIVKGPKRAVKLKKKTEPVPAEDKEKKETEEVKPEEKKEETKEVVADEAEKKPEKIAEAKPKEKAAESASSADKKPAEVAEPKKEEIKTEDVKTEPEAEKKEEKKSDEKK